MKEAAVVDTPKAERRLDWAILFLSGGAVVMTLYSAFTLYLVREVAGLVFWLGIAAHLQIGLVLSGLMALLVRRSIKISRDSISIEDHPRHEAVEEAVNDSNKPS